MKLFRNYKTLEDGSREYYGSFFAVFFDPDRRPRQKRVNLRTTDQKAAELAAVALERERMAGLRDPWNDPMPEDGVLLQTAIDRFIKSRSDRREKTLRADRSTLELFKDSLKATAPLVATVERRHVASFLDPKKTDKKGRKRSSATLRTYQTRLASFFGWAVEQGYIKQDPTRKIEKPKLRQKEKPVVLDDELQRLLRAIEADSVLKAEGIVDGEDVKHAGLHDGAITWLSDVVRFARHTGLRLGEVVNTRWSWVRLNVSKPYLIVRSEEGEFVTKSGHERRVPLRGEALEVLRRLNEERTSESDGFVFTGLDRGEKLNATYVSKRFKKYATLAKLSKNITFHSLRHTAITEWANSGIPITTVQRIAGHADVKTTMGYVHVSHDEIDRALDRFYQEKRAAAEAAAEADE